MNGTLAGARRLRQTLHQPVRRAARCAWKPGASSAVERRESRRHRHGVPGQRAGLVDRAERRDVLHDVAAAAEHADRHAAADDLAERREVGPDAVELLRAALRDAEAGHDLVEDQHRAVPRAFLAQRLEETRHRRDAVHVARDRFDDHAGDLARRVRRKLPAPAPTSLYVSVSVCAASSAGTPGRGRHAQREHARAGLHQQRVGVAVIAALELHDLLPAREAARKPDRAHRCFGAGAAHAHQLDRRHQLDDLARDGRSRFRSARRTTGRSRRLLHGADHVGVRMPEDHRAPRPDVVDVAPAVGRPGTGAPGAGEKNRLAADAAKCAHGRIDAAGDVLAGFFEQAHGSAELQRRTRRNLSSVLARSRAAALRCCGKHRRPPCAAGGLPDPSEPLQGVPAGRPGQRRRRRGPALPVDARCARRRYGLSVGHARRQRVWVLVVGASGRAVRAVEPAARAPGPARAADRRRARRFHDLFGLFARNAAAGAAWLTARGRAYVVASIVLCLLAAAAVTSRCRPPCPRSLPATRLPWRSRRRPAGRSPGNPAVGRPPRSRVARTELHAGRRRAHEAHGSAA